MLSDYICSLWSLIEGEPLPHALCSWATEVHSMWIIHWSHSRLTLWTTAKSWVLRMFSFHTRMTCEPSWGEAVCSENFTSPERYKASLLPFLLQWKETHTHLLHDLPQIIECLEAIEESYWDRRDCQSWGKVLLSFSLCPTPFPHETHWLMPAVSLTKVSPALGCPNKYCREQKLTAQVGPAVLSWAEPFVYFCFQSCAGH